MASPPSAPSKPSFKPVKPPLTGPSPEYMARVLGIKSVKRTTPIPPPPSKKRKVVPKLPPLDDEEEDEVAVAEAQAALAGIGESKPKRAGSKQVPGEEPEEKRLKRFRVKPPLTYLERLERVKTQRMFLIDRKKEGEEEVFDLAGTTGNIYQVTVGKVPKCTCPDNGKGNQCKHIIYVLVNVLKAREDLAYQLAFLSTELEEIFANAPVTPSSDVAVLSTDTGGTRKPIEGDCPVCVMEFEDGEDILWCRAACGNNIHRHCFEQWAKTKPGSVKCVYCRTLWKGDEDSIKRISKSGEVNAEGFVNVARELGLSGERDTSSYNRFWVRTQFGGRNRDNYDRDDGC